MKPNIEIVLKALEFGYNVQLDPNDGFEYVMIDGELYHEVKVWVNCDPIRNPDDYDLQYHKSEISVNNFLKKCNDLPEETVMELAFHNGMMELRKYR